VNFFHLVLLKLSFMSDGSIGRKSYMLVGKIYLYVGARV
jgi:hypothetical protein